MTPEERIDAALAGWRASWEAFDGGAGCVECGVEHGHRPDPGCEVCGGTGVELYRFLRARLHAAAREIAAAERGRAARLVEETDFVHACASRFVCDCEAPEIRDRLAAAIRAGDPAPGSHTQTPEPPPARGRPEEGGGVP